MANQSSAARKGPAIVVGDDWQKPPHAPRKWQFMVSKLDPNARGSEETILTYASENGWELVTVTESANFDRRYYFKRPL